MKWLNKKILAVAQPTVELQQKKINELDGKISELKKEVILLTLALRKNEERVEQLLKEQKGLNSSFLDELRGIKAELIATIEGNKKNIEGTLDLTVSMVISSVKTLNEELARVETKEDRNGIEIFGRVKELEEIKSRLDDGVILMTKAKLLQLIEQKIEVFEGNINNKMSGLMIYINDKAQAMQSGRLQDVDLLKKLARLGGDNGSIMEGDNGS